jgi:hypothetical protein
LKRAAHALAVLAVVPALVTLSPSSARAQTIVPPPVKVPGVTSAARDTARTLAAEALKLYEAGQYAASIELFEKADAQYPAPQYRVYAARAYAKSGKLRRAVDGYSAAVQMTAPPGAPASFRDAQKTAADERVEVQARLARLHVQVRGAPLQGVTLTLDDQPVPPASWHGIEHEPGLHQLAAGATGYVGVSQTVKLAEGAVEDAVLVLLPAPHGRPIAQLELAAGGVGSAGFVVAVVTGAVLAVKHGEIEKDCPNKLCTPAGRALIDTTGPINAVNVVGWTLGLAGLAGVVALVVVDRGGQKQTAIVPSALPGGGGLWITGRF